MERLQNDDALVEGYLTWRLFVVDDALKMIDESLQWRREFGVNGMMHLIAPLYLENHALSTSVGAWSFQCPPSLSKFQLP